MSVVETRDLRERKKISERIQADDENEERLQAANDMRGGHLLNLTYLEIGALCLQSLQGGRWKAFFWVQSQEKRNHQRKKTFFLTSKLKAIEIY